MAIYKFWKSPQLFPGKFFQLCQVAAAMAKSPRRSLPVFPAYSRFHSQLMEGLVNSGNFRKIFPGKIFFTVKFWDLDVLRLSHELDESGHKKMGRKKFPPLTLLSNYFIGDVYPFGIDRPTFYFIEMEN